MNKWFPIFRALLNALMYFIDIIEADKARKD